MESDRPIVVLTLNRILQRLTLRMTLNTGVVRTDEIEFGRVDDIQTSWVCGVFAPRTVAALTPDVPFRYCFRLDVDIVS